MKNKLAASALKAFSVYMVVLVVMVIVTEFSAPFKNFLTALTGHHWTAKGVIGALAFILCTVIFNAKGSDDDLGKNINRAVVSAVIGILVIFLFFLIHYNI